VSKTIPDSRKTDRPPKQHPHLLSPLSSFGVIPNPTPIPGVRKGEIDDGCYRTIVELFAKRFAHLIWSLRIPDPLLRYIQTFDKDRLALENAYSSEATFSCRFIPNSRSPPPCYFTRCNTGTLQGSSSIIQALSSFNRQIIFVPPTGIPLDVTIDILRLPCMNYYFVTLVFGTVIEGDRVSVDMVFLLKDNTRLTGKKDRLRVLWTPFVVTSHQIILRS
jgi:hypothetical protein